MAHNNSRLRQFELQLADDRRKQQHSRPALSHHAPARRQRSINTLGPQEDVIERRRHRNRVAISPTTDNGARGMLAENVVLLLLLAASIYGIYRLCIYILNL